MNERQGFEDALRENPRDEATHKIYADWLDENDEPELAQFHREFTVADYHDAKETIAYYAEVCEMSFDELITAGHTYLDTGDYECLPFDTPDEMLSSYNLERFWKAFQTYTFRLVPEDNRQDRFIRCAC